MNKIELNNLTKEQMLDLKEQIETKLKEPEINPEIFEEFIEYIWSIFIIKWDKNLVTYNNWTLIYSTTSLIWKDKLKIEETTLDKLKVNDLFILKENINKDMSKVDFEIVIWKNEYWDLVTQYLGEDLWIEVIQSAEYVGDNTPVIKFLRS